MHGIGGGVISRARGGDFWQGVVSQGLTHYSSKITNMNRLLGDSLPGSTAMQATIGGTISSLSGGSFQNGAMTATFAHLYNEWQHRGRVAGYGSKGDVSTNGNARFKVQFNDESRSLHMLTAKFEYTYSWGPSTYPIHEVNGATSHYGIIARSWEHDFTNQKGPIYWNIHIPHQTSSCANCGNPEINI